MVKVDVLYQVIALIIRRKGREEINMNRVYNFPKEMMVKDLIAVLRSEFLLSDMIEIQSKREIVINQKTNNNIVSIDTIPDAEIDASDIIVEYKKDNDKYSTYYIVFWESCNEVENAGCDAVIGYTIYDADGDELDGGEMDYNSKQQFCEGLKECYKEVSKEIWDWLGLDDEMSLEDQERLVIRNDMARNLDNDTLCEVYSIY